MIEWIVGSLGTYPHYAWTPRTGCTPQYPPISSYCYPISPPFPFVPPNTPIFSQTPLFPPIFPHFLPFFLVSHFSFGTFGGT